MDIPTSPATAQAAVTVRRGDTLVGLVKSHYRSQGVQVDDRQAFLMALKVARGNNIADATRIQPGQVVRLEALGGSAETVAASAAPGLSGASGAAPAAAAAAPAPTLTAAEVLAGRAANPVFERTLTRALDRGFIPPHEADAVRDRVGRLAEDYGFDPDDFARVVLIESDGMNPAANNGRCHGIIQFCGGPGRGAASVGFASRPHEISKMSVLQQLDLVDRYFQDVGLPRGGRVGLDDLYLAVLTPAARAQRAATAPLPVPGAQAKALYEGGAITRRSITQGLQRHANERLSDTPAPALPALTSMVNSLTTGFASATERSGSAWPQQRQWLAANTASKP
ncbi:LysM peptidoglycan-binding domain-containing protein [Ramlibacter sp. MAHUQ-53]|uniref:LysM peptidoglycan-binding domain-containing protein n=1 Tax=unclassified Ramlibacter TaxID=2617605 RepID=UPI0036275E84